MMPLQISKARYISSGLAHPLQGFAAVPLARETLAEVLSGYRRPGDKVSEWLREGALQPLRRRLSNVLGQELGELDDGLSFLITSPAKALCDRLVLSRGLPLLEDLRCDPELLGQLNLAEIRACLATGFKRRQLGTLLSVMEGLQGEVLA